MNHSIQKRLMLITTAVLVLLIALTGILLDRSFQASVIAGAQEQLRLVIYSLMGAVEERDGRLLFSQGVVEPRLTQPDSGLYATVTDDTGQTLWVSPSALTSGVVFPAAGALPGVFVFAENDTPPARFFLSYTVYWEDVVSEQVVFNVATDQAPFQVAIRQFRRSLSLSLGAAMLLFVAVQLLALRWGLRPLRTMAEQVSALEAGQRTSLSTDYPRELQGLARNLDRFVAHEQQRRLRYRQAMDDLAHSLKTPLAVIRNSLLDTHQRRELVGEQLDAMQQTLTRQLRRAAAAGPVVVGQAVKPADLLQRLLRALQIAYRERAISVDTDFQPVVIRSDERDVMEILGNLLENAFKYGRSKVRVTVRPDGKHDQAASICIEDDGPGIPARLRQEVLRRGRRLDEVQTGQGIGLAVVAELVALHEGDLQIAASQLGGARITVTMGRI